MATHFVVLTLYPEIFSSCYAVGLLKKAQDQGKIAIEIINFREYGIGKHLHVDAPPYGGGAGMLLRPEPILKALEKCQEKSIDKRIHKILISPQGKSFTQAKAIELSRVTNPIALICGRFEGFDERISKFVDEEISLGDFVLMGGETAAMAIIETVARLIPGVIGNPESLQQESFTNNLLEHSQYTKPYDFRGYKVPKVLISGNHRKIQEWCRADAIKKTQNNRIDLYDRYILSKK